MMIKFKMILSVFALGLFLLLFACDETPEKKQPVSHVISKKISSQPAAKAKSADSKSSQTVKAAQPVKTIKPLKKDKDPLSSSVVSDKDVNAQNTVKQEHYDSKGKIDPFKPLIQEKSEEKAAIVDKRPKRILTPLEKIELSQIRLVAVIIMKTRQLAMVEDATGKGYEVGVGTYIGKNQGRISEIKESSIMVKELVKDFKGRLKEKIQEIKLHKNDSEG